MRLSEPTTGRSGLVYFNIYHIFIPNYNSNIEGPAAPLKRDLHLVGSLPMAKPNRFDKLKGNAGEHRGKDAILGTGKKRSLCVWGL